MIDQIKWDDRYIELARTMAIFSKDPSTKTGAVITMNNAVIAMGFNGFPRGIADDERLNDRETKYKIIIHCEENAAITAARDLHGATLYTWPFPSCAPCASRAIQRGFVRVVAPHIPDELMERWGSDIELTEQLFREAGVEYIWL